ncbi:MAG: hypothetical protein ABEJ98_03925 [Candidatus Nanohaloarchaea archaeon]
MSSAATLSVETPDIIEESDTGAAVRATTATAALTSAGVLGRVALQWNPSVETVLPLAVAAGFYGGARHGFASGATGFFVTNFLVWGGQGPWTVFQCLGAGLGAASAAYLARFSRSGKFFAAALVVGTTVFELAVNAGSLLYMPFGAASLLSAAPFIATHYASSLSFGAILYGTDTILSRAYRRNKP